MYRGTRVTTAFRVRTFPRNATRLGLGANGPGQDGTRRAQPLRKQTAGELLIPIVIHILAVADLSQHRHAHPSCFFGYSLSTDGRDAARLRNRRDSKDLLKFRVFRLLTTCVNLEFRNPPIAQVTKVAAVSIPLSMLVGISEECGFRGFLPLILTTHTSLPTAAIVVLSGIFCGVRHSHVWKRTI